MGLATVATLAIGGLTAATSAVSAREQNRATRRAQDSQASAAQIQTQQLSDAVALEKQKRIDEAHRLQARLRVAAGESGISLTSGTHQALQNQVQFDLGSNLGVLDQNFKNQAFAIQSGAEANLIALQAQTQNPLLAAIGGGLQGASTGLAIGQGIGMLNTPAPSNSAS